MTRCLRKTKCDWRKANARTHSRLVSPWMPLSKLVSPLSTAANVPSPHVSNKSTRTSVPAKTIITEQGQANNEPQQESILLFKPHQPNPPHPSPTFKVGRGSAAPVASPQAAHGPRPGRNRRAAAENLTSPTVSLTSHRVDWTKQKVPKLCHLCLPLAWSFPEKNKLDVHELRE